MLKTMPLTLENQQLANMCQLLRLAPIALISLAIFTHQVGASQQQQASATAANLSIADNQAPVTFIDADSAHISHILVPQEPADQEGANTPQGVTLSGSLLKTFIRINNMRAYHLDLHFYRRDARFVGDPSFVDSLNPQHLSRCEAHLAKYDQLLKSFIELDPVHDNNSLDSLKLADAFGRPEAGALFGSQFWLGAHDNCLDFSHQAIKAHYCLGITQFPNWNPADSKTSLKIGLCLPETCTSSMLNDNEQLLSKVERMMKYQFSESRPFNKLKLRQVYCLPHETSQIRQYSRETIAFFVFIGSFVAATIVATTVDYLNTKLPPEESKRPNERKWRTILVESFSLIRNFNKFMSTGETNNSQQVVEQGSFNRAVFLNSITGLKCIGLCWIICAHTFLISPVTTRNMIDLDKLTKTYLADIYLTAHLMVDTFFAVSGLLASYFIFSEGVDKIKSSQWFVMTIHRYWRLTPVYLICYWYTKSVGFLTNSGPMWDYMTAEESPRLMCNRESWWLAILHLSDFKSPKEHCVPFAWFSANGIKFWIVTPIFLILINKSMRRGYKVTIATILANILLVAYLAFKSDVDVKSVVQFKPESADNMLNNMGEIYTRPYSRIGAYLIGLLGGHLIHLVETNQIELKLSRNAKAILWTLFSVTVIALTFILKIANGIEMDESVLRYIFCISSALVRPLWALCTCWFVFALAHGEARWVASFLSANFLRLIVKLSFCAYLVQGEVLAQMFLSPSTASKFAYQDLITNSISAIVLTIAVSFLMVLFLEYPLIGIEELILPNKRHKIKDSNLQSSQLSSSSETTITPNTNGTTTKPKAQYHGEKLKSV